MNAPLPRDLRHDHDDHQDHTGAHPRHDRRPLIVTAVVTALVCSVFAVAQSGDDRGTAAASNLATTIAGTAGVSPDQGLDQGLDPGVDVVSVSPTQPVAIAAATLPGVAVDPATGATLVVGVTPTTVDPAAPTTVVDASQDLDGGDGTTSDSCTMDKRSAALGDSGPAVTCLQAALVTAGYMSGAATGTFDNATYGAVRTLQEDKSLFVDGVVGRETALALGIWPDEAALVVHTPPPAPGAVDLLGYTLSYVATSGPDAPPLPANSGSGKRLVYDRSGQRVWAVDANERVIRSWLVSGSKYANEVPGTHHVYSKSETSTAWNGQALLPHMVRYLKTRIGNIGFHGIPRHVSDGSRYQTDQELGQRLSGGCQRQADLDADFVWDFADIGTTVVVI